MNLRFQGTEGLISILVPTRNRPKNVKRLISSALKTADYPSRVEFVFYVDEDDSSFDINFRNTKIIVVRGPRIWISLAFNILYTNSNGEIIMYGADDIVFRTKGWDSFVRNSFNNIEDKICLVYANDGVQQSQEIARHGFIHRRWFNVTGTAFPALRGMPIDLWCTEIARLLNRVVFLDKVVIEHIHFRQGKKAKLDQTYLDAIASARSWSYSETYRKLTYEMRVDRILLGEVMNPSPQIEKNYRIGEALSRNINVLNFFQLDRRKVKSLQNYEIIRYLFFKVPKKLFKKLSIQKIGSRN